MINYSAADNRGPWAGVACGVSRLGKLEPRTATLELTRNNAGLLGISRQELGETVGASQISQLVRLERRSAISSPSDSITCKKIGISAIQRQVDCNGVTIC